MKKHDSKNVSKYESKYIYLNKYVSSYGHSLTEYKIWVNICKNDGFISLNLKFKMRESKSYLWKFI